jgi:hypothetical protein
MDNQLKIFLSHKLRSREAAQKISASLAAFAGDRVKVYCSANYPPGINWEKQIRMTLDDSDWLILLYDSPEDNQDWCMFETGYFRATMAGDEGDKRIICLHDPDNKVPNYVPNPVTMFNPVPATEEAVRKLFRSIYVDPPWAIKPDLDSELLDTMISRVVKTVRNRPVPQWTIAISPRFTINVAREAAEGLRAGIMPPDSLFEGEAGWEPIFGKTANTLSWQWRDLADGLSNTDAWVYQLARMMWDAYKFKRVEYPSIALGMRTAEGKSLGIYRFTLTRFEEGAGEFHRFTYVAAPIVTPFDASDSTNETLCYHLFNVVWSFRRRLIEKHLPKLSGLSDNPQERGKAIRDLTDDWRALTADSQVRGLDRAPNLASVLPREKFDEAQRLIKVVWPPLQKKLFELIERQDSDIPQIVEILRQLEPINRFFYKAALEGLTEHSE